jgi:hypothetical protein
MESRNTKGASILPSRTMITSKTRVVGRLAARAGTPGQTTGIMEEGLKLAVRCVSQVRAGRAEIASKFVEGFTPDERAGRHIQCPSRGAPRSAIRETLKGAWPTAGLRRQAPTRAWPMSLASTENLRCTFTDNRRGWTRIMSARVTRRRNSEYQTGRVRLRKAQIQSAGPLASQRHSSLTHHRPGLRVMQKYRSRAIIRTVGRVESNPRPADYEPDTSLDPHQR